MVNRRFSIVLAGAGAPWWMMRPGVTRDLLYTTLALAEGPSCLLVDSPGYYEGEQDLSGLILKQARRAWQDAALVLMVCDGLEGATSEDAKLAQQLHRADRPIWLLVNKLDGGDETAAASFYDLGLPVFSVSAQSGFGLKHLRAAIASALAKRSGNPEAPDREDAPMVRFALLGKPNVGKSSLFNCLLGEERQLVHHEPGSTRDAVHLPLRHGQWTIRLSDTAGVRRKKQISDALERNAVAAALGAAAESDLVIYLLDARQEVSAQDLRLLYLVDKMGKSLILALNKSDRLSRQQVAARRAALRQQLAFLDDVILIFISATQGQGTQELLRTAIRARSVALQEWPKHQLNRILGEAMLKMAPPRIGMIRPKPRYVHQIGTKPPHFMLHGKRLHRLPATYIRYLRGSFRAKLDLAGCPLRLSFKNDINPYDA